MHGLHVVNTRPADRATALTQALQLQGYQVTELPLLQLDALALDAALSRQLSALHTLQTVIVVSPTAAHLGLDYLRQLGLQPAQRTLQWIAVGQGTAQVLRDAGLQPLIPEIETSEGILALDDIVDARQPQRMMIWRGVGGRELMLNSLAAQGHVLHNIVLYQRGLPATASGQYQQLLAHQPDVLLISSGESWRYWQQLDRQPGALLLNLSCILVLGQRVYNQIKMELAGQAVNIRVIQVESLRPDSILSALAAL